jgi:hypothetical protein
MQSKNVTSERSGSNFSFIFNREKEVVYMDSDQIAHYNEDGKGINDYEKNFEPCTFINPEIQSCFNQEFHQKISKAMDQIVEMKAQDADSIDQELRKIENYCNTSFIDAFLHVGKVHMVYAELLEKIKNQKHTSEKEKILIGELEQALHKEIAKGNIDDVLQLTSSEQIAGHIKNFYDKK